MGRAQRRHGRPRHLHPDRPRLNPLPGPQPRHDPNLHRNLQHHHRRHLRRPHARPAHEIHRRGRNLVPRFRRPGDHGRRDLHRRRPDGPGSHGTDAIDLQTNPSLRRQRHPALPGPRLRAHRRQVRPQGPKLLQAQI
ncbi:unnamed protein product [Linum tenue]|uniref:Uncharacterized protein n=1 Tax=Linum tenue TaxID=586396 RepID=A0AAV0K572_9ROSI|nr:unnamed protein product [Linum tenue]